VRPIEARTPADGEREGRVSDPGGASWESAGGVVVVLEERPETETRVVAARVGSVWTMCRQVWIEAARRRPGAAGPWIGFKGGGIQLFGPNGG
jgi:hypothetical protein